MREVQKSLPPETLCAQQAADMAQINALAKREMTDAAGAGGAVYREKRHL